MTSGGNPMRDEGKDGRRGVVLLLLSGIAALLLGLVFLLMAMVRQRAASVSGILGSARAGLVAQSGLAYGAARLSQAPAPRYAHEASQVGDDWAFRDPAFAPLSSAGGLSYLHGEPWSDSLALGGDKADNDADGAVDEPGEGDGIWSPGEAFADLDTDGSRSVRSGRLRGAGRRGEAAFSLRISSPEGCIPVNSGYLDASRCAALGTTLFDTVHPFQNGLAHALNSLGALVLSDASKGEKWEELQPHPGGEVFRVSWLGDDLIRNRPPGGYRSAAQAASVLSGTGYRLEDADRVSAFLDLRLPEWEASGRSPPFQRQDLPLPFSLYLAGAPQVPFDPPAYVPVSMRCAPREVLASLWMHLCAWAPVRSPGVPSGWGVPASCAGGAIGYDRLSQALWGSDAQRLADLAASFRRSGVPDWVKLRKELWDKAASLFPSEASDLSSGDPVNRRTWLQAKADLAFQAVAMDPYPFGSFSGGMSVVGPLRAWEGWGIDRDGDPADGVQPCVLIPFVHAGSIDCPDAPGAGWPSPDRPFTVGDPRPIYPLGFTLAAPCRFRIESLGRWGAASAGALGELSIAQRMELATQEDFEALSLGRIEGAPQPPFAGTFPVFDLRSKGVRVVDAMGAAARFDSRPETFGTDVRPAHPHLASLPCWSFRAFMRPPGWASAPDGIDNDRDGLTDEPGEANGDGVDNSLDGSVDEPGEMNGVFSFSRCFGALALAGRERGIQGARLYWPMQGRFDADPWNDFRSENGAGWKPVVPGPAPVYSFNPGRSGRNPHESIGFDAVQPLNPYQAGGIKVDMSCWPVKGSKDAASGTSYAIGEASIECWIHGSGAVRFHSPRFDSMPMLAYALWLEVVRDPYQGRVPATRVRLVLDWQQLGFNHTHTPEDPITLLTSLPPKIQADREWWFPDGTIPDGGSPLHVVLTIRRQDDGLDLPWTQLKLYLNGWSGTDAAGSSMTVEPYRGTSGTVDPGWRNAIGMRCLSSTSAIAQAPPGQEMFTGLDELRFYDKVIDASAAYHAEKDRFYPTGLFTSPLYVFEEPTLLERSQWTGIVPGGFPPGSLSVVVHGFKDAAGTVPAAGYPAAVAPRSMEPLEGKGAIRSFSYEVRFRCAGAPSPLNDTPVFESIWFTYRGNGRTPAWTGWSSR